MSVSRAVWMLALGQTLAYACIFYIFAALIVRWRAELGWSDSVFALGPTLAILVSAACAPFAGRAVDRGFGTWMMTGGALLGALFLAVLATTRSPQSYLLAWLGLGVAQAMSLYETCFAVLIRRFGPESRAAITRVTLVAGLASTLAFPAAAVLSASFGWRGAVWVAAGTMLLVVAPLHLIGARTLDGDRMALQASAGRRIGALSRLRDGRFWQLALLFSLLNLNHWMLVSFLIPVLHEKGVGETLAVAVASCIGPAQVAGRFALMRAEARIGTRPAALLTLASVVVASLMLLAAGLAAPIAFAFALTQGAAMGTMTILRPVIVSSTLGMEGYGATAGLMSIPTLLASAAAPVLGAFLLSQGGAVLLVAATTALAAAALALAVRLPRGAV
ncbi:MFS transporter [Tabrizicola sp. J26]|uniref:MFS transporter n=1 Tax=Alitabrizicola rongguiensis TaxID=2909234 RepID=UPI001F406EC8|nr:MFS transporter [Tabrizicola rongguiensis]MCF1708362.1 MFS transporter [Tabrizicola rongguiensis]